MRLCPRYRRPPADLMRRVPRRRCPRRGCHKRPDRVHARVASAGRRCRRSPHHRLRGSSSSPFVICQDQVELQRQGSWQSSDRPASFSGLLRRSLARLNQDAPAPGVEPGQNVADQIADHPGGTQVQVQISCRTEQHTRPWLPVRILDQPFGRRSPGASGTVVNARRWSRRRRRAVGSSPCGSARSRASVSIPRPMADWLVTTTRANPARRSALERHVGPGQ